MEEDALNGRYVLIEYIDEGNTSSVLGGKLEKMIITNDNLYKVILKESYEATETGLYRLNKNGPIIKTFYTESYRGMTPQTKTSLKKFYSNINAQINKLSKIKTSEEILKEEREKLYHHTKIGFTKE